MPSTILLVEDTRTITSLIQVYLMGWDLQFVEARDGEEGLQRAREARPDLIISDVRMPRLDGFELCAAVRSDAFLHKTPILLLTSLKDEASRQKGRMVGATAFLTKPVRPEELREQVGALLGLPPDA
jgi:twitching motility two-component system response regulator PilG